MGTRKKNRNLFQTAVLFVGAVFIILSFAINIPAKRNVVTKSKPTAVYHKAIRKNRAKLALKARQRSELRKRNLKIAEIKNLLKIVVFIRNEQLLTNIAYSVYDHSKKANIEPELVVAVMKIESHGKPNAVSRAGARGLLQVMPFWKKVMKMENADLFDPDTNIKMGVEVLRMYLKRYKTVDRALAAYNGSLGSRRYPKKVLKVFRRINSYKEEIVHKKSNRSNLNRSNLAL